jgi:hypothetical protein
MRKGKNPKPIKGRSKGAEYDEIVSKIRDVGEIEKIIKGLAYGKSGTGKTTLACHILPKPLLLIDMKEEGSDSVQDVEGVKVVRCESWEDLENLYWYLESGNHPYKSFVADTITQAQELAQKHVMAEEGKDFLSLQIRGKASEIMKTLFINFRDLPYHSFLLAQDRTDEVDTEEEDQIMPSVGPALSPGIAKTVTAMVKLIFNTYIQEVVSRKEGRIERRMEYRVRTGPHPYYITKVRKPKSKSVPDYVVDPTFDDVLALMSGTYVAKAPKVSGGKPKTGKRPLRRK